MSEQTPLRTSLKFCRECQRCLRRNFASGAVVFEGPVCLASAPGTADDARVFGSGARITDVAALYPDHIRYAPVDRATLRVARDCRDCGVDTMAVVRLGESATTIYACECGRREFGRDDPEPTAAGVPAAGVPVTEQPNK
jgi:hypothetical protein